MNEKTQLDIDSPAPSEAPTMAPAGPRLSGTIIQSHAQQQESAEKSEQPSVAALLPPGYEYLGELGRGGMGVVYKARHIRLNRIVALKMILSGSHASSIDHLRFLSEAEAVAALQHPNIVQIHEIGTYAERPFFTLEFCEQGSLDRKLALNPMSAADAAHLAQTLARAIHAAHEKGIVHRDLKPQNVLLTADGTPKVTDFGLAKRVGSGSDLTATGALLGTPSYMAPEQTGGKSAGVGPPADVYALGSILYELLTGRPPFRAATVVDTIMQVVSAEPVPPSVLAPKTPRDLETICLKCLQKEPAKRYATAAALAQDLARFSAGEPILARPASPVERASKWIRRNKGLAAGITAVTAALLLGTGVATWQAIRANDEAKRANGEAKRAEMEAESADQQKQLAQSAATQLGLDKEEALDTLYATSINLAHREWLHGLSSSARQFLVNAPLERRGWEYDFLQRLFEPERRVLRQTLQPHFVATAFDGSVAATSSLSESKVRFWDARLGMEMGVAPVRGYLLNFAPHSKRLAFAANSSIHLIDASTRQPAWAPVSIDSAPVALSWSVDERVLYVITQDGNYRRLDVATGLFEAPALKLTIDKLIAYHINRGFQPVISPDGRYFAQVHFDDVYSLKLWDLQTGKIVFAEKDHDRFIGQLAFSPDSSLIASPGGEGTIVVREISSRKIVHRLRGHRGMVFSTAFSADGKFLASGGLDTTVRLWDVGSGETVQVFRGHQSEVFGVTLGGSALFSFGRDRTVRVWDALDPIIYSPHVRDRLKKQGLPPFVHGTENDGMVLLHHSDPPLDLAFSPDGRRLATTAGGDNDLPCQIVIRDLTTRQEICRIGTLPADERDIAFSADGRLLAVLLRTAKESETVVQAFDSDTGQRRWQKIGPKAKDTLFAIHPATGDFEARYTLTGDAGATVVRYDAATGRETKTLKLGVVVAQMLHAIDGERLFGGRVSQALGEQEICEFDPESGAVVRSWPTDYPSLTASAASGNVIATAHATAGPADIVLWDAVTGRQLRKLSGSIGIVTSLAFSPDGRRLISGGNDFTARVWDTRSGRELLTLSNHGDIVSKVSWSQDGARIATTCRDGAVRVWEAVASGAPPDVDSWDAISPAVLADQDEKQFLNVKFGDWRIDDGALKGTLRQAKEGNFPIAYAAFPTIDLPRSVDIQCQVETSQPMLIAISLSNPALGLAYTPFVAASNQPFGQPGARLLVTSDHSDIKFAMQAVVRPFPLEANRTYQLRVLRQDERLRLFVDGQELVAERIPNIELPELLLQGSWSNVGDEIRFSRLIVRAPAAAVLVRKLRAKLERLFEEELLTDVVRERLAQDLTLTEADRQRLAAALVDYPQDAEALRKSARALATKEGATPDELRRGRRQAEAALKMAGGNPAKPTARVAGDLGLLALLEYRLGNAAASAEILGPLLAQVREFQGFNSLDELALAGLAEHARGRDDDANRYLLRMRDLDRPEAKWGQSASPLITPARELAEKLIPPDPAREELKEAYLQIENAGWIHKQPELYFAGRLPNCRDVDQRGDQPGPHDFDLSPEAQRVRRRMEFQEQHVEKARFLHDDWDIRIRGDAAELGYTTIVVIPDTWIGAFAVKADLRKVNGQWKIAGTRTHQTLDFVGGKFVKLDSAYWSKKDQAVTGAQNKSAKLGALIGARRYREAFELGRTIVAGGKADCDDWINYSKSALNLGEAFEAIRAAKKAHELNPNLAPLPLWAK